MATNDNAAETSDAIAGRHESIWMETTPGTDYDALDGDREVDTVVVGGGITGLTAATKLAESGQSVAVVERDRIVSATTGHTTAKLTSQHGFIYSHLEKHFGREGARRYAEANEAAIDEVEKTIAERGIDCPFERTPAYAYVESEKHRKKVRKEVEAARRADLPASFAESTPLPFEVEAAVRFDDQARFHPRKYLLELASSFTEDGGRIFEQTKAKNLDTGRHNRVETDRGTVTADDVVVATRIPVFDKRGLYFARLSPKRSYVLAVRLNEEVPEGMHYKPMDPYFSVREHPAAEESMVLVGGQNHRTGDGKEPESGRYRKLERAARKRFDVASIQNRWSTQDYVSVDRVPFVGKLAPGTGSVHVATGYGGWGLSNGTAAGMLLADRILDRENDWADVYRPTRLKPFASAGSLVSHNTKAATHLVGDHLTKPRSGGAADLAPGEATVLREGVEPVAAYRDEEGELHTVSAVCTHLDCVVEWNDGERSWDCPCHGSRFDYDGEVLDGPAIYDLGER